MATVLFASLVVIIAITFYMVNGYITVAAGANAD